MKLNQFVVLPSIVLLVALTGCSSTPSRVNKGAIAAKTFSFIATGPTTEADFAEKREVVHQEIKQAITQSLAAKGITAVPTGGDVTVAYLVIVGNNASTERIDTYFGYNRDAAGLQNKAQSAYAASKNPNYFEAGTLLIDILDSRTYKILLRNYAVRPLLVNPTEASRTANIQEAVNSVLSDLQVKP
jgi:hypothetical protein